jgi:hypothetical protein
MDNRMAAAPTREAAESLQAAVGGEIIRWADVVAQGATTGAAES